MKFNSEKCGYCGVCISVCQNNVLELTESGIILKANKCDNCGRCTIVCPLGALILESENEI
jgi:ferredoxin